MTPLEALQELARLPLVTEEGEPVEMELLPPMSNSEIDTFAASLPSPLPAEIRELLAFAGGFQGNFGYFDSVEFEGDATFGYEALFCHPVAICADGMGNHWVLDLNPESREWGPIYYVCHDPPILLYQCADLSQFLREVRHLVTPPHRSRLVDVFEDSIKEVWSTNPDLIPQADAVRSGDTALSEFAGTLDSDFVLIDLRNPKTGDGFSWGRYGLHFGVRRAGKLPIFAYRIPPRRGFFHRLLGRTG